MEEALSKRSEWQRGFQSGLVLYFNWLTKPNLSDEDRLEWSTSLENVLQPLANESAGKGVDWNALKLFIMEVMKLETGTKQKLVYVSVPESTIENREAIRKSFVNWWEYSTVDKLTKPVSFPELEKTAREIAKSMVIGTGSQEDLEFFLGHLSSYVEKMKKDTSVLKYKEKYFADNPEAVKALQDGNIIPADAVH
jgi:hypothetical protein